MLILEADIWLRLCPLQPSLRGTAVPRTALAAAHLGTQSMCLVLDSSQLEGRRQGVGLTGRVPAALGFLCQRPFPNHTAVLRVILSVLHQMRSARALSTVCFPLGFLALGFLLLCGCGLAVPLTSYGIELTCRWRVSLQCLHSRQ